MIDTLASVNMKLPTGQIFLVKGLLMQRMQCASILKPPRRIWCERRLFRVRISAPACEKNFAKFRLPFAANQRGRRLAVRSGESQGFFAALRSNPHSSGAVPLRADSLARAPQ
ncbi:MAG: hypothetical protein KDD85_11675 [Parvularculaceae bacterium]|nr:hypothetical protein [Parvularculaceae bacterium]